MNDLRGLIRYHRWRLDEKRRALAELHGVEDQLLAEAASVEDHLKAEQQVTRASFEVSFGYAAFARATIDRRARLARALADTRARIAAAADEVSEIYQEVKTYELAQEERQRQEKEKQRHKENELLDETAMNGFLRRQGEEQEDR